MEENTKPSSMDVHKEQLKKSKEAGDKKFIPAKEFKKESEKEPKRESKDKL